MEGPIRLDLGAGHKKEEGWLRVDLDVDRKKVSYKDGSVAEQARPLTPDIVADIRALPLPDDMADKARAIHVIEHFYPWEAVPLLKEWVRVLKPGGELAIECPCLEKIMALFNVPEIPPYMTFWGLYGDPRLEDPLMMHKWCYTRIQMTKAFAQAGLVDIRHEPPRFHQPARDMRVVGVKPAPTSRIVVE
jgi:predicted SAM-dependent methyltransferase